MSAGKRKSRLELYTQNNCVRLIHGGKQYFDTLCEMIRSAKKLIHLQVYIFDDDETGKLVSGELIIAAKRNVEVYVLVDGYASKKLRPDFIKTLTDEGIRFKFFNPLFKSDHFYFGRRMHQKVTVVDSKIALVAGMNITNRYNDFEGIPGWLDFGLYLEGETAKQLCLLCWKTWYNYPTDMHAVKCETDNAGFNFADDQKALVSVRRNDWVRRKNEISSTYINMFRTAEKNIIILCSYFLPGNVIRKQLSLAARRGVKIKIITAGISDIKLSKYAERYLYTWMLKNNIELFEYQPGILHGKIAVCDGSWLTIGSYNINNLSAYASIELNLNVRQQAFARAVENTLNDIAEKDCIAITREVFTKSGNVFVKIRRWTAYQISRFLVYIFTFYLKHQR
jgi:cardiolipin synthase